MATEAPKQPLNLFDYLDILKSRGQADLPFRIVVTIKVKEGKEAEILEAIRKIVPPTLKDPGCNRYEYSQELADPATFVLYEEWKSVPALEAYLQQSHTQEFLSTAGNLVSSKNLNVFVHVKAE